MSEQRLPVDLSVEDAAADLVDCARRAEDAIRRLAHLALQEPALTPAEVDVVLSHLAEAVAGLPQVASQLGNILHRSRDIHLLAMDGMTADTDPNLAVDTARLHLDAVREPAVETYRHLNAGRNASAHIRATPRIADSYDTPAESGRADRSRPEEWRPPAPRSPNPSGPAR